MLPLAEITGEDLIILSTIVLGGQAALWIGDRLWKKQQNGNGQHVDFKLLIEQTVLSAQIARDTLSAIKEQSRAYQSHHEMVRDANQAIALSQQAILGSLHLLEKMVGHE